MSAPLASVLSRYPAPLRPIAPPEPLGNAGGLSGSRLWRFGSGCGPLVARAWPVGATRGHVARVHAWLGTAAHLGFVPLPLAAIDGQTLQESGGRFWEVCRWMPGEADRNSPPAGARVASAFSGLAAFHRAMGPARDEPSCPGLADRSREIKGLLEGDLPSWRRSVLASPADSRRDLALRWLDLAGSLAPRLAPEVARHAGRRTPVQPAIRDARPDHFLFAGDRLAGLVDFGAMALDAVSADLARLLSEWIGPDRSLRAEALAAYEQVRPLDAAEVTLIDAYERSAALLGGGHWIKWHFVDGIAFEDPAAVLRGLQRGVERIEGLNRGFGRHPG